MALFLPNYLFNSILDVDVDFLKSKNIKALVLDVDNTLTTHGNPVPAPGIVEWLRLMKKSGINLMIVSNNTKARVGKFAKLLGIDFVSMSFKPFTRGISIACKRFKIPKKQVAIVGDQIFTDTLAGNLKGITTILVTPFELEHNKLIRLKRIFEKYFIKRYNKKQASNKKKR